MDEFKFVQTKKSYALSGNGVAASATSITVSNFTLSDGTNITMSMFGDTGYATLEPGTAREENISFTGVTQNANSTATLTGVTRGLGFTSPYTEDASLKQGHGGNTPLVISNSAPFYNELSGKDNDETITGKWTFETVPASTVQAVAGDDLVNLTQLNAAATGSANIDQLVVTGTAGEAVAAGELVYLDETDNEWKLADASTSSTSDNVQLGIAQGAGVNGGAIANGVLLKGRDRNQSGLTQGDRLYVSDTAGEVASAAGTVEVEIGHAVSATEMDFDPKFASYTTKNQRDALAGTSGTPSAANKYVTDDDTSDSSTADEVVRYDGNGDVDVPATPGGANKAASKTYVDSIAGSTKILVDTSQVTVTDQQADTTIATTTVTGSSLGTNNAIEVYIPISNLTFDDLNNSQVIVKLKYGGSTVTSLVLTADGSSTFTDWEGEIKFVLAASGATNTQKASGTLFVTPAGSAITSGSDSGLAYGTGTSAVDSTSNQTLEITASWSNAAGNAGDIVTEGVFAKLIK